VRPVYPSHEEATNAHWFSRRHQTAAEHRASQDAWEAHQQAKKERARLEARKGGGAA